MYDPADILFFNPYVFNDDGHEAPHFGLVIVPSNLTKYKQSILCAVMTSQPSRSTYGTFKILVVNYACLSRDTIIRMRDFDYVPIRNLHSGMTQPRGTLTKLDAKNCFKVLKGMLFGASSPIGSDKYLRATIIREWKKII